MPKRPAAHAEAMREQILEGGRRAFIAGGFRGTSVPSIAAKAGVSVGLMYRYFPSKEELFLELCISGTPAELEELAENLAPIDDPVERLTVAIDSYFDALLQAIGAPLVLQALAAAPADERIRQALRRRGDDLRGFSAAFVRDAIVRGELRPARTWTRSRPRRRCCWTARWWRSPSRAKRSTGTRFAIGSSGPWWPRPVCTRPRARSHRVLSSVEPPVGVEIVAVAPHAPDEAECLAHAVA